MATGFKPRAGRPSAADELIRSRVINKCWQLIEEDLNDDTLDKEIKRTIALEIVKKTTPQNIDFTSKGEQVFYSDDQRFKIAERVYRRSADDSTRSQKSSD